MKPLVSVGMPVYNAEKTLRRAIESILAQDYEHFELILSDNASTDATADICQALAREDARISFVRQPTNKGTHWNFNYVVGRAKGKYFVRMSHDDVRAPSYLTKCVALLEASPRAVLCHSYAGACYDEDDLSDVTCVMTLDTLTDVQDPRRRFMCALRELSANAIDGVFRTDTLKTKTSLLDESYLSSDLVLTRELMLHGEFVQVPEVLFFRFGKAILPGPQAVLAKDTPHARTTLAFRLPFVFVFLKHLRSIRRSPLTRTDKAILSLQVIGHECKIAIVKATFRTVTGALGDKCPLWILRCAVAVMRNPNLRMLKPPQDLPPSLHPTWHLLNHRNQQAAVLLQQKLNAKLYPSTA